MPHATRSSWPAAIAAMVTLLAVAPLGAQTVEEEAWHPAWGDWALSFELPTGGGPGLGFWRLRSPATALGLVVDGSFSYEDLEDQSVETTDISVAAGPALKRYWWQDGPVAPFFRADLLGIYQRSSSGSASVWRMGGSLDLGIGAEWFPLEGVGIGGHTGVSARYLWLTDDDDLTGDRTTFRADLFTSGLTLQLYF